MFDIFNYIILSLKIPTMELVKQVPKSNFFKNDVITDTPIIDLSCKSAEFCMGNIKFTYSSSKNIFKGTTSNLVQFALVTNFLSKNNIEHISYFDKSLIYYKIAISCNNPFDLISNLRAIFKNNDNDNDSKKINFTSNILYESKDFYKDTQYTKNFFIDKIISILDSNNFYLLIRIDGSNLNGQSVIFSMSPNNIDSYWSINSENPILDIIKTFKEEQSRDMHKNLDIAKINEILNLTLEYYPKLIIQYIYVGFNDTS